MLFVQVPEHELFGSEVNFADLPCGQRFAVLIDADDGAGERKPDRAVAVFFARVHHAHARRFGQPVARLDAPARALPLQNGVELVEQTLRHAVAAHPDVL